MFIVDRFDGDRRLEPPVVSRRSFEWLDRLGAVDDARDLETDRGAEAVDCRPAVRGDARQEPLAKLSRLQHQIHIV